MSTIVFIILAQLLVVTGFLLYRPHIMNRIKYKEFKKLTPSGKKLLSFYDNRQPSGVQNNASRQWTEACMDPHNPGPISLAVCLADYSHDYARSWAREDYARSQSNPEFELNPLRRDRLLNLHNNSILDLKEITEQEWAEFAEKYFHEIKEQRAQDHAVSEAEHSVEKQKKLDAITSQELNRLRAKDL